MKERSRCLIFVVAFIALNLLVFNGTGNAESAWLVYDNGSLALGCAEKYQGVRFSLPPGAQDASLLGVRFHYGIGNPIVHITEDDHTTEVPNSPVSVGAVVTGWHYIDLSGNSIEVPQNFYVIIERGDEDLGTVGGDSDGNSGRTFVGNTLDLTGYVTFDLMIRSKVEFSRSNPAIAIPWLMLEE